MRPSPDEEGPIVGGRGPGGPVAAGDRGRTVTREAGRRPPSAGEPARGFFKVLRGRTRPPVSTADGARKVVEVNRFPRGCRATRCLPASRLGPGASREGESS